MSIDLSALVGMVPAAEPLTREKQEYSCTLPRKSLVQVRFGPSGRTLAYLNDRFELCQGDLVYVEGQYAGVLGVVTAVNYSFKVRSADYKKVLSVIDRHVAGELQSVSRYFVAFDPSVLPKDKVRTWYLPPQAEEDEYTVGYDDDFNFPLEDLQQMKVSRAVFERGKEYYLSGKVSFLCLDGDYGYAIVNGTEPYEIDFHYRDGRICDMTCSCPCSCSCKHEVAAMHLLNELLVSIGHTAPDSFTDSGYFAAVDQSDLFTIAVYGRNSRITLC